MNQKSWKFEKKINFSHLLTILIVTISLIGWGANLSQRIKVLEVQVEDIEEKLSK